MLKCIAIDDEPLALELLEDNISKLPFLQLVAACENPLEAMRIMEEQPVDLVFLDIQMPGLTGLQFIRSLASKPLFILITAYEKYALEGFDLDVVDYLVKPVSLDRFIKACNKARELHDLRKQKQGAVGNNSADYFFVNVDYSLLKILYTDILWIESLKDYVRINLKSSSKPVVTRMSMKQLEEDLPADRFIRVHKSFIVSKDQVTAIRKNSIFIGPMEIPVGENYRDTISLITGKQS
ncbi:LytR/AlgR family response regulator transcription factor [Flavihumibacter stibioxidans]|uniref:DNA-binding response regulator n=1 Tax=Flavihumibacter stibioxidans TaxID=1834163 RepID=A0ABR7MAD0_9BACT|nr:LytTR family DNA-binding domain-containing protein [Flavihumibacter stibioxidans]MBC6491680.1 DNA-binding response regulator [Flavihumibacter stibioxidans]